MAAHPHTSSNTSKLPRVVIVGLTSCFGCQLQITNDEAHLLDILSQFDLSYWQLTSSEKMPQNFDIAVIEGALTTKESIETLKQLRDEAQVLITIGACAATAGIPGLAAASFEKRPHEVYDELPTICGNVISPRAVSEVVDVDFAVVGCPIDPAEFVEILNKALYGSNHSTSTRTMCSECKQNEQDCFFENGTTCLGLLTQAGCGARCVKLGRPCKGCRGISPAANLDSAYLALEKYGVSPADFRAALEVFNCTNPVLSRED